MFHPQTPWKEKKEQKKCANLGPQWVIDLALQNWSQIAKLIPSCETSEANPDALGIFFSPLILYTSILLVHLFLVAFYHQCIYFTNLMKLEIFFL